MHKLILLMHVNTCQASSLQKSFKNIYFLSLNITLQLLICELNFMDVWYISVVSDLGYWKGAIKIQFIINAILIHTVTVQLWN